jgi:hypothetical protein
LLTNQTTKKKLLLFRGLLFTCRALQNAQDDHSAELRVCFKRAYDIVLRHHHSFVIRSVVSVSDVAPTWFPAFPPQLLSSLYIPLHPKYTLTQTSITQVAIHAVPRRNDFFTRIAEGGSVEKLEIELAKWLAALDELIVRLSAFLRDGNYGRV